MTLSEKLNKSCIYIKKRIGETELPCRISVLIDKNSSVCSLKNRHSC